MRQTQIRQSCPAAPSGTGPIENATAFDYRVEPVDRKIPSSGRLGQQKKIGQAAGVSVKSGNLLKLHG
jgi:hypothetical protein